MCGPELLLYQHGTKVQQLSQIAPLHFGETPASGRTDDFLLPTPRDCLDMI